MSPLGKAGGAYPVCYHLCNASYIYGHFNSLCFPHSHYASSARISIPLLCLSALSFSYPLPSTAFPFAFGETTSPNSTKLCLHGTSQADVSWLYRHTKPTKTRCCSSPAVSLCGYAVPSYHGLLDVLRTEWTSSCDF